MTGPWAVSTVGMRRARAVSGPPIEWSWTTSTSSSREVLVGLEGVDDLGERRAQAGDRRLLVGLQEPLAALVRQSPAPISVTWWPRATRPSTSQWTMASMPP